MIPLIAPVIHRMPPTPAIETYRFGQFELDLTAGELRRNGVRVRLQPQPFKLLALLARRAGTLVSRDDIRTELWTDGTFVDFDQSVNFAIKQVREVLGDSAERPLYIETVTRRGYRFIAPLDRGRQESPSLEQISGSTTVRLQKALWTNIAELRMAEERRRRMTFIAIVSAGLVVLALAAYEFLFRS